MNGAEQQLKATICESLEHYIGAENNVINRDQVKRSVEQILSRVALKDYTVTPYTKALWKVNSRGKDITATVPDADSEGNGYISYKGFSSRRLARVFAKQVCRDWIAMDVSIKPRRAVEVISFNVSPNSMMGQTPWIMSNTQTNC